MALSGKELLETNNNNNNINDKLPACSAAGRVSSVGPVTSHYVTGHMRSQG